MPRTSTSGRFDAITADARFIIAGVYLRPFRYAETVERNGLSMTFHSQHRPIEAYFMALEAAGLLIETPRQPGVSDQFIFSPERRRWQRPPLFLHLRARRP